MTQQTKQSSFAFSCEIFRYSFFFVFLIFIFEITYGALVGNIFLMCLYFPIKIYLYSGLFGLILELVSEEELVINWRNFHKNAQQIWPIYTLILVLQFAMPAAVLFLGYSILPGLVDYQSALALTAHWKFPLFFFLAFFIFINKYIRPLGLKLQRIDVKGTVAVILLAIWGMDCALFYWQSYLLESLSDWRTLAMFLSTCLHMFSLMYFFTLIIKPYTELKKKFNPEDELYLIHPLAGGILGGIISYFLHLYPPAFVVLRALTPKKYSFREFKRVFWQDRYCKPGKLVAISCYTSNAYEAYKIAKDFKAVGSTVIMGGPHVTYLPDEALQYCDSVVIGEAEGVWQQVVQDYERGELKETYSGLGQEDFYEAVHKELLDSSPEVIKEFIEPTRGCKFRCSFCTIPSLSSGRVRKKPVEEVVALVRKAEIKYRHFTFLDNNIYNDPAYAKDLFRALKPLNITWQSFCTIDIAKNDEVLRLAKESGCHMLVFGYEIFGNSAEDKQKGKFSMADRYKQYTDKVQSYGIKVRGNFIYGFDSDNWKTLGELWKFAFSIRPLIAVVGILTPLPGSKLYDDMLAQDRITNLNWRRYDVLNLVFCHKKFSEQFLSTIFFFFISLPFLFTNSRLFQPLLFALVLLSSLIYVFSMS